MLIIPTSKYDEWDSEYDRLELGDRISRISYLTHCAALWGYDQGLSAIGHLFMIDPELE